MVPHQWPVALVVIWHIYSCLACSSDNSARDLSSSGKVVLGQRQVPCEFWADRPNYIFQPVVPAVIGQPSFFSWWLLTWFGTFTCACTAPWGMVVGTCCLQGGSHYHGEGPLWFSCRSAKLHFWAGGSWHDCAHLLWAALLQGGFRYGPAVFKGWCPHDGAGPLWVLRRSATFIFQPTAPDVIRHIYCGQGWRCGPAISRGSCTHQGTWRRAFPDQGAPPLKMASGWHYSPLSSTAWTKCAKSCQELLAEKWRLANLLKTHRWPAQWWGHHLLKTAGPYLKPPWSSAAQSKCA